MMCFGGVKLLRTQMVSYIETWKNQGDLILNPKVLGSKEME